MKKLQYLVLENTPELSLRKIHTSIKLAIIYLILVSFCFFIVLVLKEEKAMAPHFGTLAWKVP